MQVPQHTAGERQLGSHHKQARALLPGEEPPRVLLSMQGMWAQLTNRGVARGGGLLLYPAKLHPRRIRNPTPVLLAHS